MKRLDKEGLICGEELLFKSVASVYIHKRKYAIPTRQSIKYLYAPKMEIDYFV
jgi:hypothetical protein